MASVASVSTQRYRGAPSSCAYGLGDKVGDAWDRRLQDRVAVEEW